MKHCSNNGNIMINDIHYHDSFLKELIFSLVNDIKCKVNSRLIVTSQVKSNFTFKYNKDIFLICLEGNITTLINNKKITQNINISEKEYIYVPIDIEYTIISSTPCILLEIQIKYNNANDFLNWFITDILTKDENFYNNLPLIINKEKQLNISKEWVNIIDTLKSKFIEKLDDTSLIDQYYNFLVKNQEGDKCYKFPYIFMDKIINNLENYKFCIKDYMDTVFEHNEEIVTVYFWKKKISFDLKFENILKFIFNSTLFDSNELRNVDNKLTDYDLLELINVLLKNGIIEIVNE
jgi:ribosomal protein L16 Arg81 hydroxylase